MLKNPYAVNGYGKAKDDLPQFTLICEEHWPHIQKCYGMTERELQIAKYVCCGLSNRQIADSLKIRHGTIKTHIRNIYRKTWVKNKIAMLLRFVEAAKSGSLPPIEISMGQVASQSS